MTFIIANDIGFKYKKGKKVIDRLSIEIERNSITAIIGENGSGKTTLGKLLAGILKPINGTVYIDKKDTKNSKLSEIGTKIGYLFQNPSRQLFALDVKEQMLFTDEMMGKDMKKAEVRMNELLDFFDLQDKSHEYCYKLSQGEKQRLALASVISNNPNFLILDEPTTGLDNIRKNKLSNYLKELQYKGIGMIIISHDIEFVNNHAERIITLSKGEVTHDTKYIA